MKRMPAPHTPQPQPASEPALLSALEHRPSKPRVPSLPPHCGPGSPRGLPCPCSAAPHTRPGPHTDNNLPSS